MRLKMSLRFYHILQLGGQNCYINPFVGYMSLRHIMSVFGDFFLFFCVARDEDLSKQVLCQQIRRVSLGMTVSLEDIKKRTHKRSIQDTEA